MESEKAKRKSKGTPLKPIQIAALAALATGLVAMLSVTGFAIWRNTFTQTIGFEPTPVAVEQRARTLLSETSFERNPSAVWTVEERGSDMVAEWTDEEAKTGRHALKLTTSRSANQGWPGWFQTINVDSAYNYTLSAPMMSPDGASGWLSMELLDADGRLLIGYSSGCAKPSEDWHVRLVTVTSEQLREAGAVTMRIGLQQCLTYSAGTPTTLYIDDVAIIAVLP